MFCTLWVVLQDVENRKGNVPLEWYDGLDHIGYGVDGKKIKKPVESQSSELLPGLKMSEFVRMRDDPNYWRTIKDPNTGKEITLSNEEVRTIQALKKGSYASGKTDLEVFFDFRASDFPLVNHFPRKTSYGPSKYETAEVMRYAKAIRNGWISVETDEEKREKRRKQNEKLYTAGWLDDDDPDFRPLLDDDELKPLWGQDGTANFSSDVSNLEMKRRGQLFRAPKEELPGTGASYNPPDEYKTGDSESYSVLRHVPAHSSYIRDRHERCSDLFLAARIRKKEPRIQENYGLSVMPSPADLKPYPRLHSFTFVGPEMKAQALAPPRSTDDTALFTHRCLCLSIDPTGEWLAAGGDNGIVYIYDIMSGKVRRAFPVRAAINSLAWNPYKSRIGSRSIHLLAVACGPRVLLIAPGLAAPIVVSNTETLIRDSEQQRSAAIDTTVISGTATVDAEVVEGEDDDADIDLEMFKDLETPTSLPTKRTRWLFGSKELRKRGHCVSIVVPSTGSANDTEVVSVKWHKKGDFFASVTKSTLQQPSSVALIVHSITQARSQFPLRKNLGEVQDISFSPKEPVLAVAFRTEIRVFNLQSRSAVLTFKPSMKHIAFIQYHRSGEHLICSSNDSRTCWCATDYGVHPWKTLRFHSKAVRCSVFHPRLPLMATCSDDGSIHVFHSRVYDDLRDPLLIPVQKLENACAVLHIVFHPVLPWLVAALHDGSTKLYTF